MNIAPVIQRLLHRLHESSQSAVDPISAAEALSAYHAISSRYFDPDTPSQIYTYKSSVELFAFLESM